MKPILTILALAVSPLGAFAAPEFSVPDTAAPRVYAQRVLDSDHATIASLNADNKQMTITVSDRKWLERFAQTLSATVYQPQSHIFAVSTPIIFYRKDGRKLLEIQVFGTSARFDSRDYEIGRKACEVIANLVRSRNADQTP